MIARCAALLVLTITASGARSVGRTLEGRMVSEDLPLMGTSLGGSPFRRTCPDNHVLTGVRYRKGAFIDGIGIQCRPVRADGTLGTQINSGEMAGGNGGTYGTASCPANNVIASQRGADNSEIGCHEWIAASRTWKSARTSFIRIAGGVGQRESTCSKAAEPGHGIYGRHGMIIDRWGVSCDSP